MSMTKKEQARVEDLSTEAALRRTSPIDLDVPPPKGDGLSRGFLFAGESTDWPRVEPACSSSVHHGFGSQDETLSQNPRSLYSTRLRALRALRYAVESHACQVLRRIDRWIEEETVRGQTRD